MQLLAGDEPTLKPHKERSVAEHIISCLTFTRWASLELCKSCKSSATQLPETVGATSKSFVKEFRLTFNLPTENDVAVVFRPDLVHSVGPPGQRSCHSNLGTSLSRGESKLAFSSTWKCSLSSFLFETRTNSFRFRCRWVDSFTFSSTWSNSTARLQTFQVNSID